VTGNAKIHGKNAKIREFLNCVIFKISKTLTGFYCSGLPVKKLRQTVKILRQHKAEHCQVQAA